MANTAITTRLPPANNMVELAVSASPVPLEVILGTNALNTGRFAFVEAGAKGSINDTFNIPVSTVLSFTLPPNTELWVSSAVARTVSVAVFDHVAD